MPLMLKRATVITVFALALAPAEAIASSQDISATHAYIQANYALNRAGVSLIHPAEKTSSSPAAAQIASRRGQSRPRIDVAAMRKPRSPGAELVYQVRQHKISIFIFQGHVGPSVEKDSHILDIVRAH